MDLRRMGPPSPSLGLPTRSTPEGRSSVRGYGLRMTVRADARLVMLDISRCFVHDGVRLFPRGAGSAQVIGQLHCPVSVP